MRATVWDEGHGVEGVLYSWDVRCEDGRRTGPGGIGSDRERVLRDFTAALQAELPGSWGTVWTVRLRLARNPEYRYEGLLAMGVHAPGAGAVTVGGR